MIFLTVGTWYKGYDRLVRAVDELVAQGGVTEPVTAQIGYGAYRPQHLKAMDFCSPEQFRDLTAQSTTIVSHAGMGTIIEALKQNKPLVALPRKRALGEVSNDHQFTTARQLEAEGKILVAYEESQLSDKIRRAADFVPAESDGAGGIVQQVADFIEQTAAQKAAGGKQSGEAAS